jgi:predicted nucleic acid-binding protein
MKSACVLDTNVLIYAIAGREDEPRKHSIAIDLFRNASFGVSGQVLAEFTSIVGRRFGDVVAPTLLDEWLEKLSEFPVIAVDAELVRAGLFLSRRYQITYYDGAILAAAERLGAPILYTEDLNHGQSYGPVKVINPFRPN